MAGLTLAGLPFALGLAALSVICAIVDIVVLGGGFLLLAAAVGQRWSTFLGRPGPLKCTRIGP